jgi:hypothetical protein
MNLRRKTFLIVTVALITMTLVVYVGAQFILLDNYEALEKQRAEVNVKRCLSALSTELSELDSTDSDWAAWDDTQIDEIMQTAYANITDQSNYNIARAATVVLITMDREKFEELTLLVRKPITIAGEIL